MKLRTALKKFKDKFTGKKPESVAVVGGGLGPIPGKVDFRKIMQSAGKVTWPTMRGIMFAPTRRVYKKRPQLFLYNGLIATEKQLGKDIAAQGVKISRSAARIHFLIESANQGNRIAKDRRKDYVKRRTVRHRKLVEAVLPGMFAAEMAKQGLGAMVGSGTGLDMTDAGPTFK